MKRFIKKNFNKKAISTFLLVSFLFFNFFAYTIPSNHASAQRAGDVLNLVGRSVGACIANVRVAGIFQSFAGFLGFTPGTMPGFGFGEVPVFSDDADIKAREANIKEELVDCLVWTATQAVAQAIGQNTISWAIRGKYGSPFFVRDEMQFFAGIEDIVARNFIEKDLLNAKLPDYFKTDVINAVIKDSKRVPTDNLLKCDSTENVDNFFRQPFTDYAQFKKAYLGLVSDPACLPFSAYLLAKKEKERKQYAVLAQQQERLKHGDGYLPDTGPKGEINTPGTHIKQIVQRVVETNINQLEDADEIAEFITALLNSLVTDIFSTGGSLCNTGFAGGCSP